VNFYWEESIPHIEQLLTAAFNTDHVNRFQHGYDNPTDLINDVLESSWVGVYEDEENLIHGFIILEWISDDIASLHVCTFTNSYNWLKVWSDIIEPEVKQYCNQLYAVIPEYTPGMVVIAKRIGFKFTKLGNYYKGLKDL
jgi:hypothetical protein